MRRCGLDALFRPAAATGVVGPHCPFGITPGKVSECTNVGRLEARGKRSGIRGRTERAALQAASEPLWLDDSRIRFDTAVDVSDMIFKASADATPSYASMGYHHTNHHQLFFYTHKQTKEASTLRTYMSSLSSHFGAQAHMASGPRLSTAGGAGVLTAGGPGRNLAGLASGPGHAR